MSISTCRMKEALLPFMHRRVAWMRAVAGAFGITTCMRASGRAGAVGSASVSAADMARM